MSAALPVVRSLFSLASGGATGILRIHHLGISVRGGTVSRLELEQGFVHGMSNMGEPPRGEDTLLVLLGRLPDGAEPAFESRAPRATLLGQPVPAFHPARVLRRHVEVAVLQDAVPPSDEARVELRFRPHASCVSVVESQVVGMLTAPRRFGELVAGSARPIVERLIGFLAAAGSVEVDDPLTGEAWATLGLPAGAGPDEIKRAWRQLARQLHPDLHREASDDAEAAERTARFHRVSAAYKRLLPGG